MPNRLPIEPKILDELCRKFKVAKLSLFGSVLKGTARPDSDIDLLVEFESGATPTLLDLSELEQEQEQEQEQELSRLLGGRTVDLRTPPELSRYFRDDVLRDAEVQYVAG